MTRPHPGPESFGLDAADTGELAVFRSFMRATHAHRQLMSRKMSRNGIHPSQMFCLKAIAHTDGITQRDLAEELNIARPTLTVMLQKMERAGLIKRIADSADQRFTHLHLTPAGEQLHEEMHRVIGEVIGEMAGNLSANERLELSRLLDLVSAGIDSALSAPVEETVS